MFRKHTECLGGKKKNLHLYYSYRNKFDRNLRAGVDDDDNDRGGWCAKQVFPVSDRARVETSVCVRLLLLVFFFFSFLFIFTHLYRLILLCC